MSKLVDSLKRLFPGSVSLEQLKTMVTKEPPTITPEEYKEITGEDFAE